MPSTDQARRTLSAAMITASSYVQLAALKVHPDDMSAIERLLKMGINGQADKLSEFGKDSDSDDFRLK